MNPVLERTAIDESADRADRLPDEPADGRLWWVALGAAMALATVLLLYVGRGTTFWFDEWNFVVLRRGWSADALLLPHNEHLSLLPVLVYKLGFETVGLDSYLPYRLVAIALHLTCVGLLFAYARPRVGPALAFAGSCVLLVAGAGWQDVLWAFQIGYLASLAAGLGALLLLGRRTRRADIGAGVLLAVALSSSSLGIPLLAVCALDVAFAPGRRRRWPIIVVPALLYGLWYLNYGVSQELNRDNVTLMPSYVAEAAAYAVGAVFGLGVEWGRPLALVVGALVAWRLLASVERPWRLVVLVALPLSFWALTAVARADLNEPGASRYVYPGMLFVLLVLAEAGRGLKPLSRRALVLVACLLGGILLSNVAQVRDGGGWLRDRADGLEGGMAAVDLAGAGETDPGFVLAPADSPQLPLGPYRELRDQLAPRPADLTRDTANAQEGADDALLRLGAIAVRPGGAGVTGAPAVDAVEQLQTADDGGCLGATGGGTLQVTVPAGGLSIQAVSGGVDVAARRFSRVFPEAQLTSIPAGATSTVAPRRDASPTPWHAQLKIAGEARVCGA